MKHTVLALKLHNGKVQIYGEELPMKLPDGCIGIMFAFESKKKAREYWGKDVPLARIEHDTRKEPE